jgi:cytochrome b6-f complex iron-sulfur subunit
MAEKISELTGAAREQRIAELKAKMQEAAKQAKAAHEAGESPAAVVAQPTQSAAAVQAPAAQAVAVAEAEEAPSPQVAPAVAPSGGNGAVAPKPRPAPKPTAKEEAQPEPQLSSQDMTRREFITYAWAAALGLLALEAGVVSFLFMYPRFRAGEFGGQFFLGPESALPDSTMPPQGNTTGKFWMVTTEEGEPRALYMVCTHLGCLYKWEQSNFRFECPCHGSKFTHDGHYIEGPAPRSLDTFEVIIENGEVIVDTGSKINGAPAVESPARAEV